MIRQLLTIALLTAFTLSAHTTLRAQGSDKPAPKRVLRIIGFGAHPDDNELRIGGTAILWAKAGHKVKLVSVTNGDIGHHTMAGGPLAQRRTGEVKRAAEIMGVEAQVLDIHDGELLPTLENRKTITRLIREWKADIVFCHRPWDYHPDHRYTGVLVQDAAFMVTVPYFCPDVPALKTNPVFMYYTDRFQKPYPFDPDVAVAIDNVFPQKLLALEQIQSQFLEWWQRNNPIDVDDPAVRQATIKRIFATRWRRAVQQHPDLIKSIYGENASKVHYAEAFELCEYGRQPKRAELLELFPIEASIPK
ncbi:MAG: GlcNAc-PI de-N-acetylase [Planctomycetaceae bacterium]|nr:GlcNAc-PI de-N-acetylase [Planctomycetaceae bacterium]